MNRQQRRLSRKNNTSQPTKNDWNIAMMKSEPSEQKSQNSEAIPIQNLPTQYMNMTDTPNTTTNTPLKNTPNTRENLPPPQNLPESEAPRRPQNTGTLRKSAGSKAVAQETVEDPLALSPQHEKKAQQLASTYAQLGILIMGVNPIAGKIIFVEAETRARELLRVARHHKQMMRVVDNIIEGNDYLSCALGHLSMLASILALSNRLPENGMTTMFKFQGLASLSKWEQLEGSLNGSIPAAEPQLV